MVNRIHELYWLELVELKVTCAYTRRYRDEQARWVTRFAVIRAVVSVSALGTWAAVKAYPMVWGGIIAAAQVADAVQNAMPFATHLRGANALLPKLDALFVDGLMELESIRAGGIGDREVLKLRHDLLSRRGDAEAQHMPGGTPIRPALLRLAEEDADAYFKKRGLTGSVP